MSSCCYAKALLCRVCGEPLAVSSYRTVSVKTGEELVMKTEAILKLGGTLSLLSRGSAQQITVTLQQRSSAILRATKEQDSFTASLDANVSDPLYASEST